MSNALLIIDTLIAGLELMDRLNLSREQFQDRVNKLKSEGRESFTVEELEKELLKLKSGIDTFHSHKQ